MTPGIALGIAFVVLLLVAASALFSAIETALFSLQPYHIDRLKKRKASFAEALEQLLDHEPGPPARPQGAEPAVRPTLFQRVDEACGSGRGPWRGRRSTGPGPWPS